MKIIALVFIMTINVGNLANIGEVADCGRFTSSYQELAPAPTTDPVAPYLTPDATPCPAPDNAPAAPSEEDDNQPSHYDAPTVPTNELAEAPHPASDNTPEPPSETADNTPAHSDASESNNCPEAPTSVDEVGANDASNVNTHCDMPTE